MKEILNDRLKTHGDFEDNAYLTQSLYNLVEESKNFSKLSYPQREGIRCIFGKIARMCNGEPTFLDHAVDIVGYAQCMVDTMKGEE